MKTKRRYQSEAEIIEAIDKCHELAQVLAFRAEELDKEADELFKQGHMVESAKEKRLKSAKMRLKSNNLTNRKAKKLGEKLSEFRTTIMPILGDTSIPV